MAVTKKKTATAKKRTRKKKEPGRDVALDRLQAQMPAKTLKQLQDQGLETAKRLLKNLGRPTKYRPEMCEEIVKAMGQSGLSKEAAAASLGIGVSTLYDWCNPDHPSYQPDFSEAVKIAEAAGRMYWESIGRMGMVGQIPFFNAATWIFNMKNRHDWVDKREVTGDGQGGVQIIIQTGVPDRAHADDTLLGKGVTIEQKIAEDTDDEHSE